MKLIKSITAVTLAILLLFAVNYAYTNSDSSTSESSSIIDTVVFPHDEVVDVNIEIDEDAYAEMNANAMSEEIVMANITYNGNTFNNVGIRPKGNSSLRDVFQSDSDRYSFKIDFNYYIDEQNFYGITKLNLNNLFSDPSMMAEYLGYEMLDELDAVSSRTTYVNLSLNGEPFGLYLAVEQVNEEYLLDNFDNDSGDLYKPEGVGANLAYISDDGTDYTGLVPENAGEYDNEKIAELIKTIEDGGDLDSILNVDSLLKYLAVSTMTVHLDSYQGGMFHNYYLYNNDGIFEWISWDLNMIFNGFPGGSITDEEAAQFLIDEPVKGSMESYPLIEAIFENESYVEKYHEYLTTLSEGYLDADNLSAKVLSVYDMIKSYVKADPTSFYTYDEFENGLFQEDGTQYGILSFAEKRVENVAQQLSGEIPSTNNGEGNVGSSTVGGMKEQKATGDTQQIPADGVTEQALPDDVAGQALPDGATGRVPPDGVTGRVPPDGATGQAPPDDATGQALPDDATGQALPDGVTGQVPTDDTAEDISTDSSTEMDSTDIIVLLVLTGILLAMGLYLKRKH